MWVAQEIHTAVPVNSTPAVWMVGDRLVDIVRNEMDALTETISDKSPVSCDGK